MLTKSIAVAFMGIVPTKFSDVDNVTDVVVDIVPPSHNTASHLPEAKSDVAMTMKGRRKLPLAFY